MAGVDHRQLTPCDCPDLVRLGPNADGGYVVPRRAVERSTVLLSLGVKQDWSFERQFAALNPAARIVGVDPSVGPGRFLGQIAQSLPLALANAAIGRRRAARKQAAVLRRSVDYFRFFRVPHRHLRKRVAAANAADAVTLSGLIDMVEPAAVHAVFVKMDIEGAEYEVAASLAERHGAISCIVAEFHRLGRHAKVFNRAIAALLPHFRIVHVHGNNYGGYSEADAFPDVVEITLVHDALMSEPRQPSPHTYPRPALDFPNQPARADYPLRFS